MVQHCINAASSDLCSYNSKIQRDAIDAVGIKTSSVYNTFDQNIFSLGSHQFSSLDFFTNVLPNARQTSSSISTEQIPLNLKTSNQTSLSTSSSGYGSVLSHTSKSRKSLFFRLKRLISFPGLKRSSEYSQSSSTNDCDDEANANSPILSFCNPIMSAKLNSYNESQLNSSTRFDGKQKSTRRPLASMSQHIPFTYGLKNCGNTCYINAIVQCLCHTEQLAVYMLLKNYEIDIRNVKHALADGSNSSQQHSGFKVTRSFVQIFQALWSNSSNSTSKLLYEFKSIISLLNKQYAGNEQNDAQEFLLFLINTIHDELNLANVERTRQKNNQKGSFSSNTLPSRSSLSSIASSELAHRAWLEYIDNNQSIITSTFSAQLHSTLCCNRCKQESKTFEPYLLLSLPIPQKVVKPVFVTVVFLDQSPKQLQIGLCLPVMSTVKDVREAIAQQSNLDPSDLAIIEIQQSSYFSQVFHDTDPINRLTNDVYAIQFPSSQLETVEKIPATVNQELPPSSSSYINILVINRIRYSSGVTVRFGAPLALRLHRQLNYRSLQLSIVNAQNAWIRSEVASYTDDYVILQLALVDQYQITPAGVPKSEYSINHELSLPLYLEKVIEILDTYDGPGLGPVHIQVYADWFEKYLGDISSRWSYIDEKPDVHQSVAQARAALHQPQASSLISLADCFSLFTQSESLNHDDAWMCSHCRHKENGTVKHLKIWTTPSVLILHLKRFCQTKVSNSKLMYPVQFPLVNLSIKRFLSTTKYTTNDESETDDEQSDSPESEDDGQYGLYDLFAVCNHRGSMSNGHYIAYCKNPITGKWFSYDDHLVSELDPSRVCTPDAYILFYKRRDEPSYVTSQSIPKSTVRQIEPSDGIIKDFNETLNLERSASTEKRGHQYSDLQPPLSFSRKLRTPVAAAMSDGECTPKQMPTDTFAPCQTSTKQEND